MQPGRSEPVEKIGGTSHYDAAFYFSHPYFVFSFGTRPAGRIGRSMGRQPYPSLPQVTREAR